MVNASDFDRKMLLLATQLANEHDMKKLLLSVLETLLVILQKGTSEEQDGCNEEIVTLIRCVIRLVVKLMGEPGSSRYALHTRSRSSVTIRIILPSISVV